MGIPEKPPQAFTVSCWQLRKISLFHLARTHPTSFFPGSKWAVKQVKQRSLRRGSASLGTPAEKQRETPPFDSGFFVVAVYPVSVFISSLHPAVLGFPLNMSGNNLRRPFCTVYWALLLFGEKGLSLHNLFPLCPFWLHDRFESTKIFYFHKDIWLRL